MHESMLNYAGDNGGEPERVLGNPSLVDGRHVLAKLTKLGGSGSEK